MKHQKTKSYKIIKAKEGQKETLQDEVVEESSLSIYLNGQKISTLMCTPQEQKYLGIGFLFSEGLVKGIEEIKRVVFHSKNGQVRITTQKKHRIPKTFLQDQTLTSGCGKGKSLHVFDDLNLLEDVLVNLEFTVNSDIIAKLMRDFELRSSVFRSTGGTHSAALADKEKILLFKEDIGRHNAVDKVLGESLIKKYPCKTSY